MSQPMKWRQLHEQWTKNGVVAVEKEMEKYLQKSSPERVSLYRTYLPKARKTVLKRLLAAFLRENVYGFADQLTVCQTDLLLPDSYRMFPFNEHQRLVIPIKRQFAFKRYELADQVFILTPHQLQPIEHVVEFFAAIMPVYSLAFSSDRWVALVEELCNAGANQALAYVWREQKRQEMTQLAKQLGVDNVLDFVQQTEQSREIFFEQFCVEGHHLHPSAKTKLGLLPQAVDWYAPECANQPFIQFVAVHKAFVKNKSLDQQGDWNEFVLCFFSGLQKQVKQHYPELLLDQYRLLPVHNWQLNEIIPQIYQKEMIESIVLPLPKIKIPASASSSFRTLFPHPDQQSDGRSVKVAIHSQMTSTVRSISPQTTMNATTYSELIDQVMAREPDLQKQFVPIREIGGGYFDSLERLKQRNLSVVFREAVSLDSEETAIVAAALYDQSPLTGKPILADVVEKFAQTMKISVRAKAAYQWMIEYAKVTLQGYLSLMIKYGIGLEGHMQNSIPIFNLGRPVKMMFRDWGGMRVYRKRLLRQGFSCDVSAHSLTWVEKVESMRNKVFYTVFQSHMGELIIQLCKLYQLDERKLWREIAKISEEIIAQIASDEQFADQAQADRAALFQPQMRHKALTIMRLSPDQSDQYVWVPNPLFTGFTILT